MTCGTIGASADSAQIIIKEESTFGVTPAGNPKFDLLRFTSESLGQDTGTTLSNEITGDRKVTDIIRTSVTGAGDIAWELSYQSAAVDTSTGHDLLWEAALGSASWLTQVQVTASDITIQSIATAANPEGLAEIDSAGSGFGSITAGSICTLQGSTPASNNTWFRVEAATSSTLKVKVLSVSGDFTDEAAGASLTITQGPAITDGSVCRAFTIEEEFTDLTSFLAKLMNGMVVGGFNMAIPTEGPVTGAWTFLGTGEVSNSTSTVGDGAPRASEANDVMSGVDNVHFVTHDTAAFDLVSMSITGTNNLRPRRKVASPRPISVGQGRFELSGTVQAWFATAAYYDLYLNFTNSSITVIFTDNAQAVGADALLYGNSYVLDIPRVKLTAGRRVASGINTDIIEDMGFSAKKHEVHGFTVSVTRFDKEDTP